MADEPVAAPSTNTASSPPDASPEDAPPTLAEPASGPVAAMSGALEGSDAEEASAAPAEGSTETEANGDVKSPATPPTATEPEEPTSPAEDTEMKDETATAAGADGAVVATNGTSGSSTKKQTNGKRKSSVGVPEHKSKKLNKKKSVQKITHLDAEPGQYFFARLKSYPPWPSILCDEQMLPQSLLTTRPVTTKQQDGTYKEAYADGGKRAYERTFPVMFLHTNEFAWIPNTDLTPLKPEDCEGFAEKGKTKSLIQAYNVATEGKTLKDFKEMLSEHQKAMQEDQDRREAREAAKVAKGDKKKRKSETTADDEDEDLQMDDADVDGEVETSKKPSKKRKKDVDSEDEEEKPAKTPKTATKLKLTTPKAPGTTEKKVKDTAKASKPKGEKKKAAKAAVSDEEVVDEEAKEPEKTLDPAELKKQREKEVLFLRHKLQKGFLSRDQAPQESEMAAMSGYIKKLEDHGELEVSIIRTTKINKVLKALIKLNTIPKDEEFNFRGRSVKLLETWNRLLGSEGTTEGDTAGPSEENPTTNGVHKTEGKRDRASKSKSEDSTKPSIETTQKPGPDVKKDEEPVDASETDDA